MKIEEEKEIAIRGKCIMVGLQMDRNGSDLLSWVIGNAVKEGDWIVAVNVSRNSVLLPDLGSTSNQSLIKALDNFLAVYQSLCNMKKVVLVGRICQGISIRKTLVKEAENCVASTVVVGLNKNCSLVSSASMAKYCAKKLYPTTAVIAIQNGKVVFERGSTKPTSDSRAMVPINASKDDTKTPKSSDVVSRVVGKGEGWNDRRLVVYGTTKDGKPSGIKVLVRKFPDSKPGWPLLQRAVMANVGSLKETQVRNLSVVQWVMKLPDRTSSSVQSLATDLIRDLELILLKNSSTCKWFRHEELEHSANQFSAEHLIGKGGSSQVYKGSLSDGQKVAIKVSKLSNETSEALLSEVDIITALRHERIVPLMGLGVDSKSFLSIYDYFPRGSLEENLYGKRSKPPLSWEERFKVAVGVAEGLNYLHSGTSPPVIHRDVKSSNILLSYDFEPKISDFGLAMSVPTNSSFETQSDVVGTFGYLAPEYFMYGKVSDKIDVYAYGVVLLELLTGRKPINDDNPKGQESLVMWASPILEKQDLKELLDSNLDEKYDKDQVRRIVLAASLCIRRPARLRPQMSQVLRLLRGEEETDPWISSDANNSYNEQDDEAYPASSVGSHLSLALLDVEDDDASTISFEQNHLNSLDEYLRERWSRSSSFD